MRIGSFLISIVLFCVGFYARYHFRMQTFNEISKQTQGGDAFGTGQFADMDDVQQQFETVNAILNGNSDTSASSRPTICSSRRSRVR